MLKWFIIGTLLYYAVLLWRYRDSLGTWFTNGKKQQEQPEKGHTPKTENKGEIIGTSHYRMGQMRTNGDILGHLSKAVDNASIFAPQSDEAVMETPDNKQSEDENTDTQQPIDTEFEMEYEAEKPKKRTYRRMKSKRKKSPVTWAGVNLKWRKVSHWRNWRKWYKSFR